MEKMVEPKVHPPTAMDTFRAGLRVFSAMIRPYISTSFHCQPATQVHETQHVGRRRGVAAYEGRYALRRLPTHAPRT